MTADVSKMIDALDAYQSDLYPAESNHLDSRANLSESNCILLGAYQRGELVGIAAAKKIADYGELKRLYVPESLRGNGIAELLVSTLEYWLIENEIYRSYLETGIHQLAALKFYTKLGYQKVGPFGTYQDDPLSIFMTKDLSSAEIALRQWTKPFYLVGFSSQLIESSPQYRAMGDEMVRLVREQNGFIGICSVRNVDGSGFTASYWQDFEAISAWRNHSRHLEAQKLGREEFYKNFRTSIAHVESLTPGCE